MPSERPNILIIIPDELRADALGYAGHPVFRTPHIDRIAREGVWFSNAYCSAPLCMPARASMLTGTYPHNHHIQENAGSLPPDEERLRPPAQGSRVRHSVRGQDPLRFGQPGAGRTSIGPARPGTSSDARGFEPRATRVTRPDGRWRGRAGEPPHPALGGAGPAGALPGGLPPAGRRPGRRGLGQPPPGRRVRRQLRGGQGRGLAAGLPGTPALPADRRLRGAPPALRRPRAVRLPLPPGGPPGPHPRRGAGGLAAGARAGAPGAPQRRRPRRARARPGHPSRRRRGCASPSSGWPTTGARSP